MRHRFLLFWIGIAAIEIVHRLGLHTPFWLDAAGPWFVLLMTILPLYEAYVDLQIDERREALRTALWAVLGVVTLWTGPDWLRFA